MIPYEDITVADARMYWNGCACFRYDADSETVRTFVIEIGSDTEYDEDDEPVEFRGDEPFESHNVFLAPTVPNETGTWVSGRRLFKSPEYIMHRFMVEYVPIFDAKGNATKVLRVCVEPTGRMACKGLSMRDVTYLPLVEVRNAQAVIERYREVGVQPIVLAYTEPRLEGMFTVHRGIASVLQVGTPPSMRRLVTAEQASINAKSLVRSLFEGDSLVAVPDFSLCVIKHRSHNDMGYVLYRGNLLGTVHYHPNDDPYSEMLSFTGTLAGAGTPAIQQAEREGKESLLRRLVTNNITWEV